LFSKSGLVRFSLDPTEDQTIDAEKQNNLKPKEKEKNPDKMEYMWLNDSS